jgi:hypothetical protein
MPSKFICEECGEEITSDETYERGHLEDCPMVSCEVMSFPDAFDEETP